jgi:hypothetical protein
VVPHGVIPPAQLFSVPRTRRPSGSALVRAYSEPATGPVSSIVVIAVIRRLRLPFPTGSQLPESSSRRISTTEMPWAIIAMRFCSAVVGASSSATPENMSCSSVYSWFTTSSARWPPRPTGSSPM